MDLTTLFLNLKEHIDGIHRHYLKFCLISYDYNIEFISVIDFKFSLCASDTAIYAMNEKSASSSLEPD